MLTKEWFSDAEIAGLKAPGMATTARRVRELADREGWRKAEREGTWWRKRAGRGAGVEYHWSFLPPAVQAAIFAAFQAPVSSEQAPATAQAISNATFADFFMRQSQKKKDTAQRRLEILQMVDALILAGQHATVACQMVAPSVGQHWKTLWNWRSNIRVCRDDERIAALVPEHRGCSRTAECSVEAWDFFTGFYLRLSQPSFAYSYRETAAAAKKHGWTVPSDQTIRRRVARLPKPVVVLGREGEDGLHKLFPALKRDRNVFRALEAVNADGHRFDVMCEWPDGYRGRPMMCAFQDIYSGMILSYRVDRTENADLVRLAFGDLIETFGIPQSCYLDNGRAFASKWLTGGMTHRHRFKIKAEEPAGIMKILGIEVHWANPYRGQSKPIERAFGGLSETVSRDPRLEGAYTGKNTTAKPANYGSRVIPIAEFETVLADRMIEHNERIGRDTDACRGKLSFKQAFEASFAQTEVRVAAPFQRQFWLLAAEGVLVGSRDGAIEFYGNRFWHADLHGFMGKRVVVRFDPQQLHDGLYVYETNGKWLCHAPVIEAVGFNDTSAARDHARDQRHFNKMHRESLKLVRRMTPEQVGEAMAKAERAEAMEQPKVVRLISGAPTGRRSNLAELPEQDPAEIADLAAMRPYYDALERERGHLRIVPNDDD